MDIINESSSTDCVCVCVCICVCACVCVVSVVFANAIYAQKRKLKLKLSYGNCMPPLQETERETQLSISGRGEMSIGRRLWIQKWSEMERDGGHFDSPNAKAIKAVFHNHLLPCRSLKCDIYR